MKKIIHHTILPIGLGLAAGLPALAIEPPRDDAPPPPSVKTAGTTPVQEKEDTEVKPAPRERVVPAPVYIEHTAFLGIISAEVPDFLANHLGIEAGEGVFVRDVAPDSPARKAGLEKYDVILRVAGKSVGSPADLSREISTRKPDEEVSLDIIHKGKEAARTVKLEARPGPALARRGGGLLDKEQLDLDGLPGDQADRIRNLLERRLLDMREQQQKLEREFDSMRSRRGARESRRDDDGGGLRGFHFKSDTTFRLMDNDGSVEMKSGDGGKEITVRDRDNNVLWSGPWNTEEEKAAAPENVRGRINKLKLDDNFRGNGFRFRFGPGFRDDEETR